MLNVIEIGKRFWGDYRKSQVEKDALDLERQVQRLNDEALKRADVERMRKQQQRLGDLYQGRRKDWGGFCKHGHQLWVTGYSEDKQGVRRCKECRKAQRPKGRLPKNINHDIDISE